LEGLQLEDAVQFLLRRTGQSGSAAATRIARAFDSLPLALEQAAAYIETSGIELQDYEHRLIEHRPDLLDEKSLFTEYPLSVYSAISLNVDRASGAVPRVGELLVFMSYLSHSTIPRPLIYDAMLVVFEGMGLRFDDFVFDRLVAELQKRSLIVVDDHVFSTHPLVQAFIRDSMPEGDHEAWSRFVLGVLARVFPNEVDDSTKWPQCEVLIDHVVSAAKQTKFETWNDEFVETLHNHAGLYLHARGREEQAFEFLSKVLDRSIAKFGEDDPSVAIASNNIMNVLAALERIDEALELGNRAITIFTKDRETYDTFAIELGKVLSNVGRIHLNQKKDADTARTFFGSAIDIHIGALGFDHYTVAIDINNLGTVDRQEAYSAYNSGKDHAARTNWRSAYRYFSDAVSIHRSALPPYDYRLGVTLLNLGNAALHLNLYNEAQVYLQEALKIYDKLGGGAPEWEHVDVLFYLGLTMSKGGKATESLVFFDRALDMAKAWSEQESALVQLIRSVRGDAAFQAIRRFFCYHT
jgi:tetratricopeptide (TPR) repeat protein